MKCLMEQSYFQIQLDRAIKEAEKLLKQLNAVKTDYAEKRIEEALTKSVTAAKISEGVALKTRALPMILMKMGNSSFPFWTEISGACFGSVRPF